MPPGFTITTDASPHYMASGWPAGLDAEIAAAVAKVEKQMGRASATLSTPCSSSAREPSSPCPG